MIGVGTRTNIGPSRRAASRGWTPQNIAAKVLFWGKYADISGGEMPNLLGTDALTVAGSAGAETYQCPNTAPYIAADTDYIWFKTDETQRTTTTAELVGYDLQRTPVKYDNDTPNALREIVIFKAGESLTESEVNSLHRYLQLPILWSGVLNANGSIKDNRVGQNLWTPEITYDEDLVTFMTGLATPLSETYAGVLDSFVKGLKSDLSLTNLSDYFDVLYVGASETVETTARNLAKRAHDGTINVTTAPYVFYEWLGILGDAAKRVFIDTNYNPSTEAEALSATDNSMGMVSLRDRGASAGQYSWGNQTNSRINPLYTTVAAVRGNLNGGTQTTYDANNTTKLCLIMSRSGNNIGSSINGAALNVKAANASGFTNAKEYFLAYNNAGTDTGHDTIYGSMYWRAKHSNDADCAKIWARVRDYFIGIGRPIIPV